MLVKSNKSPMARGSRRLGLFYFLVKSTALGFPDPQVAWYFDKNTTNGNTKTIACRTANVAQRVCHAGVASRSLSTDDATMILHGISRFSAANIFIISHCRYKIGEGTHVLSTQRRLRANVHTVHTRVA